MNNFIPRGSILKNTGGIGILALVIYTGIDTKLIQNQIRKKTHKRTKIDRTTQMLYVIQALSVTFISICLGFFGSRFVTENKESKPYIFEKLEWVEERSAIFTLTYILLLVRFLPLDVIVLVETHKMI